MGDFVDRYVSPTGLVTDIGFEDGKMLVRYQQDATPAHELNQQMRNSDEFTKTGIKQDFWKVGHLSEVDCLRMMTEHGFDPYKAKAAEILAFLRRNKDKWGHVLTTRGQF